MEATDIGGGLVTLQPPPPEATGGSPLDRMRVRHAQVSSAKTTKVLIAGYKDPRVAAAYRLLPPEEAQEIGARAQRDLDTDLERLLWGSIDVLIAAVQGFYAVDDSDVTTPLDHDGDRITSYSLLASALGHETSTARAAVVNVFFGNENAAVKHSQLLQQWMNDTSIGLQKEFLGEA